MGSRIGIAVVIGWSSFVKVSPWETHYETLRTWEEGMPRLSDAELESLLSTGVRLPGLLFSADDQGREWLDTLILLRAAGEPWPELTPFQKLLTRERFEWAFAMIEANQRCGIRPGRRFDPRALLTDGWDAAGASQTHEDFLRRYLPEVLQHGAGALSRGAGE